MFFFCLLVNLYLAKKNQAVTNFNIIKIHGIKNVIESDLPLSLKASALTKNPPWERY